MSPRPPAPLDLLTRLRDFCRLLRYHGVPVGLAAEIDLARALERIDVLDRAQVRWACRSILATSPDELKTVDAVFSAFWDRHGLAGSLPWTGEGLAALSPDTGRRRTRLGGRPGGARDEAPTVVVPVGTYSPHAPGSTHPISLVRDVRLRALRHGARRFRRHYATRPGRRFVRSRHGSIELRDTVRQSLRLGGELVELRRQEPRIGRAEIVVVWDVSGSMREHESPLFALVHALESVSRGARVFAFSTHLTEITDEVRRHGYRRAAERVGRRLDRTDGGTRIGASLAELRQRFAGAVGERSTLVIVSDGWDLGEADRVALELDRLRRRAHAVVWINPYARRTGFAPRVAALRAALPLLDALIGPEDFESRSIVRPIDLTALPPV